MNQATLLWSVLFGSIGLGFFLYGRKQSKLVPLLCGLLLMAYPYFIDNTWLLVAIGVGLVTAPYFIEI